MYNDTKSAKLLGKTAWQNYIYYRMEALNQVVDVLSRKGEEGDNTLLFITRPYWPDFQELIEEVEKDDGLKKIVEEVKKDRDSHLAYMLENERLHYKGRLVLLAKSKWISRILAKFYNTTIRGYSGVPRLFTG